MTLVEEGRKFAKYVVAGLAANLSHEFKSPLTSIRGAAELLAEGAADDPDARGLFLHKSFGLVGQALGQRPFRERRRAARNPRVDERAVLARDVRLRPHARAVRYDRRDAEQERERHRADAYRADHSFGEAEPSAEQAVHGRA